MHAHCPIEQQATRTRPSPSSKGPVSAVACLATRPRPGHWQLEPGNPLNRAPNRLFRPPRWRTQLSQRFNFQLHSPRPVQSRGTPCRIVFSGFVFVFPHRLPPERELLILDSIPAPPSFFFDSPTPGHAQIGTGGRDQKSCEGKRMKTSFPRCWLPSHLGPEPADPET